MTDGQVEGSVTTFSKSKTERATSVRIERERKIGSGKFGTAYEAEVAIGRHKKLFVIKRFNDIRNLDGGIVSAEENAAAAMRNYGTAKKAGLKVFPTYRLGEDKKSILMTSGNTQTSICLGTNGDSPRIESLLGRKIDHIAEEDLDAFIDGAFQQAIIAGDKGITLHGDAFLFFVDRETRSKVDFVLGDLDNLTPEQYHYPPLLLRYNLSNVLTALNFFMMMNVEHDLAYEQVATDSFHSIMHQQGLTNV